MAPRKICFLIAAALCFAFPVAAADHGWKRLYVFGDSYSDSGAGFIDGNGPTWAVYLAQDLDLSLVANGAADANGKGINFAVSAGQSGEAEGFTVPAGDPSDPTKNIKVARGILTQVKEFQSRARSGEIRFDPKTTVFIVEAGLNDGRLPTQTTVSNVEAAIRILSGVGGRNVLVTILPEKIPMFSLTARRINPGLMQIPADLAQSLPNVAVHVSNWGRYYDEIMDNPAAVGFTNATDRCAGRLVMHQDATPCADPDHHFYYTEGHPSTAVHKIVGRRMVEDLDLAFRTRNKAGLGLSKDEPR